jgi:D-aspartate ligase
MNTKHPALILGLYLPGIAILKHLSGQGVNVTGTSYLKNAPGFLLRDRNKIVISPSPMLEAEALLKWMMDFSNKFDYKPVIFVTSDDYISFLSQHRVILEEYFLFPWDSSQIALSLTNKLELFKTVNEIDVPLPHSIAVESIKGFDEQSIKYPCLIKPLYANEWRQPDLKYLVGFNKLIIVSSKVEMNNWKSALGKHKINVILQELVPGKDKNLFYCVVYRAKDGELKRAFCGQKLRITPIHFGSASYVVTCDVNPFIPAIEKILNKVNYVGPAGIEFKKDDRDGLFKLIEINARFGLWDDLGIDLNTDVFSAYYEDMTNQQPIKLLPIELPVKWMSLSRDIPNFLNYIKEGDLSFFGWLKNLLPPLKVAEFYKGESHLFISLTIGRLFNKIRRKFNV